MHVRSWAGRRDIGICATRPKKSKLLSNNVGLYVVDIVEPFSHFYIWNKLFPHLLTVNPQDAADRLVMECLKALNFHLHVGPTLSTPEENA